MSIRGDMEAHLWAELGEKRAREVVEFWFGCLTDADFLRRAEAEGFSNAEIVTYCRVLGALKEATLTRVDPESVGGLWPTGWFDAFTGEPIT